MLTIIKNLGNYCRRIDPFVFDVLNWRRIKRDGLLIYGVGVAKFCAYVTFGSIASLFLGPLSFTRSIQVWLMYTGPDKASHFIDGIESHLRRSQFEDGHKAIKIVLWPQKFPNESLAKLYQRVCYFVGPRQRFLAKIFPFILWRVVVKPHSATSTSLEVAKIRCLGKSSVAFSGQDSMMGSEIKTSLFSGLNREFVLLGFTSQSYRRLIDQKFHPKDDLFSQIPDPSNYLKAVKKLQLDGIDVVRQGLNLENNDDLLEAGLIVPDTTRYPNGFVDVWLASNCKFLVSACTGSHWFGVPFNKPVVITDIYVPVVTPLNTAIVTFQLPWNIAEERFEDFSWMLKNQRWCFDKEKLGSIYKVVHNSPEQIVDVVDEQIQRLNETWSETDEDRELQQRFRRLVWGKDSDSFALPKVGTKFLREHQHLLPD